jgi:hypothetical protein
MLLISSSYSVYAESLELKDYDYFSILFKLITFKANVRPFPGIFK